MNLPPADLLYLNERFRELAAQVREIWETSSRASNDIDTPALLGDAMSQLIDMLERIQDERLQAPGRPAEIDTLSEYGLHLFDELAQFAASLDQPTLATEIEDLCLPFALWVARHDGEIKHLAPVVNALAHFANQGSHPQAMANLYTQCCELVEATNPACEELLSNDPNDPWRLLLLNRAIVATRSHNPELMEPAFDAIVERLPGDAPRFFTEGMEQMAAINYPDQVSEVMRRYFLAHASPRRLH